MGTMLRTVDGLPAVGHSGFWGTQVVHVPGIDVTVATFVLQETAFRAVGALERASVAAVRPAATP
jgi:hypothetical protein